MLVSQTESSSKVEQTRPQTVSNYNNSSLRTKVFRYLLQANRTVRRKHFSICFSPFLFNSCIHIPSINCFVLQKDCLHNSWFLFYMIFLYLLCSILNSRVAQLFHEVLRPRIMREACEVTELTRYRLIKLLKKLYTLKIILTFKWNKRGGRKLDSTISGMLFFCPCRITF